MRFLPFLLLYLVVVGLQPTRLIVRQFVLPSEPDESKRDALEACCLYTAGIASLVALSFASWIVPTTRVLMRLSYEADICLGTLAVFSLTAYILFGWLSVRLVMAIGPDSYLAPMRGGLGLELSGTSWVRLYQFLNISLGLMVEMVSGSVCS